MVLVMTENVVAIVTSGIGNGEAKRKKKKKIMTKNIEEEKREER